MKLSKAQVIDLLKGWQQENQKIGYLIEAAPETGLVSGAGRIMELTEDSLHIDPERLKDSRQEFFWVRIPLPEDEDAQYSYEEAREFEEAKVLQEMEPDAAYDASLRITIAAMGLRFVLGSFLSLR